LYPDLSDLINQHRYNPQIVTPIVVELIEHEEDETLKIHEHIQSESGLDEGEIDGIMLSVMKGHPFVTNDGEAIMFFNAPGFWKVDQSILKQLIKKILIS
jgi:hypothetical protein